LLRQLASNVELGAQTEPNYKLKLLPQDFSVCDPPHKLSCLGS